MFSWVRALLLFYCRLTIMNQYHRDPGSRSVIEAEFSKRRFSVWWDVMMSWCGSELALAPAQHQFQVIWNGTLVTFAMMPVSLVLLSGTVGTVHSPTSSVWFFLLIAVKEDCKSAIFLHKNNKIFHHKKTETHFNTTILLFVTLKHSLQFPKIMKWLINSPPLGGTCQQQPCVLANQSAKTIDSSPQSCTGA